MNRKIRLANSNDVSAIAEIAVKCFPQDYISMNSKLDKNEVSRNWIEKHLLMEPFGFITVAEQDNKVVGFGLYFMIGGLSGVMHAEQIAVDPNFQRKGIGSNLMIESENILKDYLLLNLDTKLKKIVLTTSSENPSSHDLYKKQGYKLVANLGEMFFSGDEIMYEKVI